MHCFLIFLFFTVAKCAPSGLGFGPSTVASLPHSNGDGYYGGSHHSSGLSTVATFTGNPHASGSCTGPYGCGTSTLAPLNYAHGNGYNAGVSSYTGSVNGYNAGVSGYNAGGFNGGGYNSGVFGTPNAGLVNTNSGTYANTDGFGGGLSNGHLQAGAINAGAQGSFAGAVDGHLNAGSAGSFQGNFNNGFDGHLSAGGSGSLANSINAAGGSLGLIAPTGPQAPIVTKDFFFHTAAEDNDGEVYAKTVNLGPARKHYRVVFIKAPSQSAKSAALQILQAQNEEKTVIYVLSKKTDGAEIHTEIQGHQNRPTKPEVFFIKYKTPEEAIHAQRQIQAQYDALGGVSRFSDEGIKPVTSIIGSLGQGPSTGGAPSNNFGHGGFAGPGVADLSLSHSSGPIGPSGPTGPGGFPHPVAVEASGNNIHGGHAEAAGTGLFSASNNAGFESSIAAIGGGGHGHGGSDGSGHFSAGLQAPISSSLGASGNLQGGISTTEGYLPPKH